MEAEWNKYSPIFELTAAGATIYAEEPKIFTFMAQAITSEKAFDNFSTWVVRYTNQLATELIVQQTQRFPAWINVMFPAAYAALSTEVTGLFIENLRSYLKTIDNLDIDTATDS